MINSPSVNVSPLLQLALIFIALLGLDGFPVLAADAPKWLHGRAHKELGKIADLSGDRSRAIGEYRTANRICKEQHDGACADEASALIGRQYR